MNKDRHIRFRIYIGIVALFTITMGVALYYTLKKNRPSDQESGLTVGARAPEFALRDLQGKTVRLTDQKGQVVLIDFWATWCRPCKKELPLIQRAYDRYKEKGLVVLTINTDLQREVVPYYMSENGYTFPVLFADGKIQLAYNVRGIPALFIIDENGSVRFYRRGFNPGLQEEISRMMSRLL